MEWYILLSLVIKKYPPMRDVRVSDKYCPWINDNLKALMKQRDKLKMQANEHKLYTLMNIY